MSSLAAIAQRGTLHGGQINRTACVRSIRVMIKRLSVISVIRLRLVRLVR